ncbi:AMP-binding protein [Pseudomonas alkylphenolica]|uniref:Long-chain-fatty-acid--CoA ligase n=1 Tax=Pseudomonas alkylphenolica TaxID=237609 RepID=A0A077F8G2_9PSED|nr:AMP-binding protein [Pseudomonas alkylphenolica]AIL61752.1 AMP-dependent synthetase and ligase [Pseudomonas alkylphenolica]
MTQSLWAATYQSLGIVPRIEMGTEVSLVSALDQALLTYAGRAAFQVPQGKLSYAELDRQSAALAAWLQNQLGVQRGDRIAVMLPNILAYPVVMLGVLRAGCVLVNANPLYTVRELEHQLHDADCKAIFVYSGSTATLAQVLRNPALASVICVGDGLPGAGHGCLGLNDEQIDDALHLEQVLAVGRQMQRTPVSLSADDLLFLQYTGGTTGLSKGAMLSHANLLANIAQYKAVMPSMLRPGEEVLATAIPLYHIFALMVSLTYMTVGATNWLVANPRDMDGFIELLKQARPSVFMGVNTLYAGLLAQPRLTEVDFSYLRLSIGGGAAIQAAVSERWLAMTGTFIREGFGLSETSPMVSFNPEAITEFTATTGVPVPGTDVRLLDDDGRNAAAGAPGEICVKGPQVMQGYWRQPDANAQAFTADGYFRTGDIGTFDARGLLKIVDRKKDMIIVSGFNVFPNEVEEAASRHPGLLECACVGVPDDKTGEAVCLYVVRRVGSSLEEGELSTHLREYLAAYKVPRRIVFVAELPKSGVGKILRRKIRELA